MGQIILNYLAIFVIPLLVGISVRFLLRRAKLPYLLTIGLALLTAIAWIAVYEIPSHGSELYALRALQSTSAAVGSLLTGLVLRWK